MNDVKLNHICNTEPEYFMYSGKQIGPTILFLGATHGNEPSGYHAIKKYMNKLNSNKIKLEKGILIFVPVVNYCGLQLIERKNPILGDINRLYDIHNDNNNNINSFIIKLVKKADIIIDFHESYGFSKVFNYSMGSTLSPVETKLSHKIANKIISKLNKKINDKYKKYAIYTHSEKNNNFMLSALDKVYAISDKSKLKDLNAPHTLRKYIIDYNKIHNIKKDYILVEIARDKSIIKSNDENNIQPLDIRIKHALTIISCVIKYVKLI